MKVFKRVFAAAILVVCLFSAGCATSPEGDIDAAKKKLTSLNSYSCEAVIKVTNNRSTNEYKMRHFYSKEHGYRVEALLPKELEGQFTIYDGEKVYIYHPKIDQYLVAKNFEDGIESKVFFGAFLSRLENLKSSKLTRIKQEDLQLLLIETPYLQENKYLKTEKLWIDIKKAVPAKAEFFDEDEKARIQVHYYDFKLNPKLDKSLFEVKEK